MCLTLSEENGEEASVKGYLKQQGWGAELGYPGIILDNTGDEIKGYIFSSDKLDSHWDELDDFEGEEYPTIRLLGLGQNN